ncbi:MAG: lysophospholipase [Gammaproteobacteria bacterium]|nr:lysophospholipase [Gammaproteobacteria bacterium]
MKRFQSIDVSFVNDRGITIAARLELPEQPRHFAIFSPCFTCTKETLASYRISQQLAKNNIAVLRLDFTGLGESEGHFSDSNFSTMIGDITAASQYLQQHYQTVELLIGHSMGGTASYAAAAQLENIRAVVSIASPSDPAHVTHHFGRALQQLESGSEAEFYVAGKAYTVKPQFLADLKQQRYQQLLNSLGKACLIFHGESDQLVAIDHAERLFTQLKHPKSFISLDTADHILSDRRDAQYVAELICNWSQRYLSTAASNS